MNSVDTFDAVITDSEKEKFDEAYQLALTPKHRLMRVTKRPECKETGEGEKKTLTFISPDGDYDFQVGFENGVCWYIHIFGDVKLNFLFYRSGKISLDYKGKSYYTMKIWQPLMDLKLHFENLIKEF